MNFKRTDEIDDVIAAVRDPSKVKPEVAAWIAGYAINEGKAEIAQRFRAGYDHRSPNLIGSSGESRTWVHVSLEKDFFDTP